MATLTQQKTRTVKLTSTAAGRGIVTIVENGKPTSFYLSVEGEGYRLEKFEADCRHEGDDVYHVAGDLASCGCIGHRRHGRRGVVCRHRAALVALRAAGRLS